MTFPVSPANNDTATVNGITYVYSSATNSWARTTATSLTLAANLTANKLFTTTGLFWSGNGVAFSSGGGGGGGASALDDLTDVIISSPAPSQILKYDGANWINAAESGGGGITYTSDTAPHALPNLGDQWYDTLTDILYEYIEDGTSYYWVDIQSPIFNQSLSTNLVGNLSTTGNLVVSRAITATGNISTVANLTVTRNANIFGNILGGNITVTRNATVSSNLTVVGNTIVSNVTASGNITSTGNISANNISATNNISTPNITVGNLTVTGNVSGNLTLTGNVTADNLVSTDLLTGNIIVTSNLAVTGNLAFTGANVNLGNVANIHIDGGTTGQFLRTDGSGNVAWQDLPLTSIQEFTAIGGQTVFTIVGTYTVGTVLVFVNGIQMNSVDYTATDGTTVVLAVARIAGDTIRIVSSVGASSLSSGLVLSVTNTKNFAVAMSVAMGI